MDWTNETSSQVTATVATTVTAAGGTVTVAGPTVVSTITAAGAVTIVTVVKTALAGTVTCKHLHTLGLLECLG